MTWFWNDKWNTDRKNKQDIGVFFSDVAGTMYSDAADLFGIVGTPMIAIVHPEGKNKQYILNLIDPSTLPSIFWLSYNYVPISL